MLPDFSTSHCTPATPILQTLQLLRLHAEQALQILVAWFAARWCLVIEKCPSVGKISVKRK